MTEDTSGTCLISRLLRYPPQKRFCIRTVPQHRNMSTSHSNPQQDSPLFRLPGELRNEIYTLAFQDTHHRPRPSTRRRKKVPKQAPVVLLLSCKRVYQEAKSIYYSTTTLTVEAHPSATQWLTALPLETLTQLRAVHLG